jgi:hypothetical protein
MTVGKEAIIAKGCKLLWTRCSVSASVNITEAYGSLDSTKVKFIISKRAREEREEVSV